MHIYLKNCQGESISAGISRRPSLALMDLKTGPADGFPSLAGLDSSTCTRYSIDIVRHQKTRNWVSKILTEECFGS